MKLSRQRSPIPVEKSVLYSHIDDTLRLLPCQGENGAYESASHLLATQNTSKNEAVEYFIRTHLLPTTQQQRRLKLKLARIVCAPSRAGFMENRDFYGPVFFEEKHLAPFWGTI